jgi:hypothetical protein
VFLFPPCHGVALRNFDYFLFFLICFFRPKLEPFVQWTSVLKKNEYWRGDKGKKVRTTSHDAGGKSVSEKSKSDTGAKCVSENSTSGKSGVTRYSVNPFETSRRDN